MNYISAIKTGILVELIISLKHAYYNTTMKFKGCFLNAHLPLIGH